MGIQSHFDDFHGRIKLTRQDERYKKARTRDDSITAAIKTAFKEAGYEVIEDFLVGSHAYGTAVVPLDGDYDIDRALVIAAENAPDDPVVPKILTLNVLENRGFKNAKIKMPCVTADYASESLQGLSHLQGVIDEIPPGCRQEELWCRIANLVGRGSTRSD